VVELLLGHKSSVSRPDPQLGLLPLISCQQCYYSDNPEKALAMLDCLVDHKADVNQTGRVNYPHKTTGNQTQSHELKAFNTQSLPEVSTDGLAPPSSFCLFVLLS
jgi:hypothetical protein